MDRFCVSTKLPKCLSLLTKRVKLRDGTYDVQVRDTKSILRLLWTREESDASSRSHTIRFLYQLSYETVDITGAQMVLTMKLTTFAWNVWDGRRPAEVCQSSDPFPKL
jgi:hypothetical protein